MKTRQFEIGDILSITTGRLVARRHMDAIYDILNFMTGDDLYTHQLPRVHDECKPHLLEQFPQFKNIEIPKFRKSQSETNEVIADRVMRWLDEVESKYGKYHEVKSPPDNVHERKNPIEEAEELVGKGRVHVIALADNKNAELN